MQTSEVLNKAGDLIQERGWGRGPQSMGGELGLCLEGAVYAAAFDRLADPNAFGEYDRVRSCPAGLALYNYLAPRLAETGNERAWEWNDDTGRTAAEVIEVLRAAAVIEQAKEAAGVESLQEVCS